MAKSKGLAAKAEDVLEYRPKPTIRLDAKDLPAIKNWKVGKTYKMTVTAKLVFMSEGDEYDSDYGPSRESKEPPRARFRITSVKEA